MTQRIPVEPLRKAVADSNLTVTEIADRMGYKGTSGVRRILGEMPRDGSTNQAVNYETAVKLVRALGRDPHEFGI